MNVPIQRGEHKAIVGQDDTGHGAGEAAEAVAVLGIESGDVEPARDVEEVDRAVWEPGGEVAVGEGQAATGKAVVVAVVVVGGDEVEGGVEVSAWPEVGGRPVAVDVLLPPRVAEDEMADVPDT